MEKELDLFEAYGRSTDPQTSHDAAESISGQLSRLEAVVLEAIKNSPNGLTIDELDTVLDLDKVTISPRIKPLCKKNKIYSAGKRLGRSGRPGLVWKAC